MNERQPREPAPPHVQELVDACVRYVKQSTGIELDFSGDTLPLLDHYLRQPMAEGDAMQPLLAAAGGAYFGELVRGCFPCRWHAPRDDYGAWRIEFEFIFLHFNPVAFAHEALTGHEMVEGGAGFGVLDQDLDAVRAGLEALGTLNEEDYFKLSTRFEVLATVVDRLMGQNLGEEEVQVRFDPEAYRMALDEVPGSKPS